MAAEFPITVRAGRDFYLRCNMVTALGNPANLTGYQIEMTVKGAQGDTDANALYKQAPWFLNLPIGQFYFHITPTQNSPWWVVPSGDNANGAPITSTMVYDVSCLDIADPSNLITLMEGSVGVIGPVTVTIP